MAKKNLKSEIKDVLPATSLAFLLFVSILAGGGANNQAALFVNFLAGAILAAISFRGRASLQAQATSITALPRLIAVAFCFILSVNLLRLTHDPITPQPAALAHPLHLMPSTVDISRTVIEELKLSGIAATFMIALLANRSESERHFTLIFLSRLSSILTMAVVYFYFSIKDVSIKFDDHAYRLYGTFASPNVMAAFLSIAILLQISTISLKLKTMPTACDVRERNQKRTISILEWIACTLILVTAMILTASRAAVVTSTAVSILLIICELYSLPNRSAIRMIFTISGAIFLFFVVLLASGSTLLNRFALLDKEASIRYDIYRAHISILTHFPFLGLGPGSFSRIHLALLNENNYRSLWNVSAMHNVYLQWLEGYGIISIVPLYTALIVILLPLLRCFSLGHSVGIFCRLAVTVLATLGILNLFDFSLENLSICIWLSALLAIALSSAYSYREPAQIKT